MHCTKQSLRLCGTILDAVIRPNAAEGKEHLPAVTFTANKQIALIIGVFIVIIIHFT